MLMKNHILILILLLSGYACFSQTHYDFSKFRQFPSDSNSLKLYTKLCDSKEFDRAIVYGDSLRQIYTETQQWHCYHFFTNTIAHTYASRRKYADAVRVYEQAMPLLKSNIDTFSVEYIYTCSSLCNFYYYLNQSNKSDSIALYLYSLLKSRGVSDSIAVNTFVNISGGLASLSHFTEAYDALITCKKIAEKNSWHFYLKNIPVFLGYTALMEGKDDASQVFYEESLARNSLESYQDSINYLFGIEGVTQLYFKGGSYSDCINWGKRALSINEELRVHHRMPNYSNFRTNFNSLIYKSYLKLGDTQRGDSIFNYLVKIESEQKNNDKLVQLFLEYAEHKLHSGQVNIALSYYLKAKQVADSIGYMNSIYYADIFIGLSETNYSLGNFLEAAKQAQRGFEIFTVNSNKSNIYQIPDSNLTQNANEKFKLFLDKLVALYGLYNLSPSEELENSIINHFTVFDEATRIALSDSHDEKFIEERQIQYKKALDGLVDFFAIHQKGTSYEAKQLFLQKMVLNGKAMRLYQQIQENKMLDTYSSNKDFFAKYRDTKNEIIKINGKRDLAKKLHDSCLVRNYTLQLSEIYANALYYESILKTGSKSNEALLNIAPLENYSSIQQKLNIDEALLEYYSTEKNLFSVCITKDAVATSLNPVDKFSNLIENHFRAFKTGSLLSHDDTIYQLLIDPYSNLLHEKNHLIIIPDETLSQYPFETINTPDKLPLLFRYSISYCYSSSLWLNIRSKDNFTQVNIKSVLAIAPDFSKDTPLDENLAMHLRSPIIDDGMTFPTDGFTKLPYTKLELDGLGNLIEKKNIQFVELVGDKVTKNDFLKNIKGKDIIHIASHGIVDRTNPLISGIVLSAIGKNYNEDNILYHYELFKLGIDAKLVVLSACNTGVGQLISGEGLMALPQGFIYAGVPNVIASLWKVHDEKTKDLMLAFYKHLLNDNVNYAEALRRAKLDCIKKGFLSLDWAGFILIGE